MAFQVMTGRETTLARLHLFVLSGFAVAQPLYDLLGRNAEFFVAQGAGWRAITGLVLVLSLGVPVLVVSFEAGVARLLPRTHAHVDLLIVALLLALIALSAMARTLSLPGSAVIAIALLSGIFGAAAYKRITAVKTFFTILSPSVLIFPMVFLVGTPVRSLVLPSRTEPSPALKASSSVPIVIVVFDEMSTAALLDEDRHIDGVRYPHFGALAERAYWFPNATAVDPRTPEAVAALVTGQQPEGSRLPFADAYPENLFGWLGASYRLNVSEAVTAFCPEPLCREQGLASPSFSLRTFASDVLVLYLHLVTPDDYASLLLPSLAGTWGNFRLVDRAVTDEFRRELRTRRHRQFEQFLERIRPGEPSLNFIHILLPHHPYEYLPSGRVHSLGSTAEGLGSDGVWGMQEELIATAYHQYLLQVGFVDTLLGSLIERLEALDLYDSALLVVTADHGVAFLAGESNRKLSRASYPEILPVPMLVKLPGQRHGQVSARQVSALDLLPTIADVLDVRLPWTSDGISMVGEHYPERQSLEILGSDTLRVDAAAATALPQLNHQLELFGSRSPLGSLMRGPSALLGHRVVDLDIRGNAPGLEVVSEMFTLFEDVRLDSGFVPALFRGRVDGNQNPVATLELAIALNQSVRAVTRTTVANGSTGYFSAILPESAFRDGPNEIEFFIIKRIGPAARSQRIPKAGQRWRLIRRDGPNREVLVASTGREYPVVRSDVDGGWLDRAAALPGDVIRLQGWAADVDYRQPAKAVIVFAGQEALVSGSPREVRDDVAEHFADERLRRSGFTFDIPKPVLRRTGQTTLRLFAVFERGLAGELRIASGADAALAGSSHPNR